MSATTADDGGLLGGESDGTATATDASAATGAVTATESETVTGDDGLVAL